MIDCQKGMKSVLLISSGLAVAALLFTGCPVASTQQATNDTEPLATPVTASPVDPFVPRKQIEDRQVELPTGVEPETAPFAHGFPDRRPASSSDTPVSAFDSPVATSDIPLTTFDSIIPNPPVSSPTFEPLGAVSGPPVYAPEERNGFPPAEDVLRHSEDMPNLSEDASRTVEAMSESESSWTPTISTSFAEVPATTVFAESETPTSFAEAPVTTVFAEPETPTSFAEAPATAVFAEPETPQLLNGPVDGDVPHSTASSPVDDVPFSTIDPQTPNSVTYDPVKANGEYFVGWPKPKLLLVFTGFINGYVEPCGCAGLEQMKGGLSRRSTFLKELDQKGWPVVPIEAGNLNKGFGRQEEWKYNFVVDESLRQMRYEIVGLGNRELQFPTDVLILYCVDVPGSPCRYTSANVMLWDNPTCIAPFRTQTVNGVKVGVISVMGASQFENINNQDLKRLDIVDSLKEVLPTFDEEKCDHRVLIVHGSNAEFQAVLNAFPNRFDFALCSDGPAEPPARAQWIENTMNVEVGEKGKYAIAIGLFDDVDRPIRYQRVALDSRFKNSPDVMQAMQFYQDELKRAGLSGLGIKAIPNRRAAESGKYVGSKACADCHEPSQKVWQRSKHAQAWKSLAETAKPARIHDPECIACHVVGWSPTEFLPYASGFMGENETPHLVDVGCESCHGPGERHIAAEMSTDDALKQRLRRAVRLPLEGNVARKLCIECHDGDNSPQFDFDTYWPKIQHKEE